MGVLLEEQGYDGWTLRDVAERSRSSLATIYKHFPSREALIVSAVERWMEARVYRTISAPSAHQSIFEALAEVLRSVFEPWERHPKMLQVFIRACSGDGRKRLRAQGLASVEPLARFYEELDPAWAADVQMIVTDMVEGVMSRYLVGDIEIGDILRHLERTLQRLEQVAAPAAKGQP